MSTTHKSQAEILQKLGIETLNPMQEEALEVIPQSDEVILLSPTGTGKTVAFLLPVIGLLDPESKDIQVIILVPSRELAIQIETVLRDMGAGLKVNAVYGGRHISHDKIELKHPPAILIGTPGRVADHMRRKSFDPSSILTLILDEFDKSLEVGFEDEMHDIVLNLHSLTRKILTSATQEVVIPKFVGLKAPKFINNLEAGVPELKIRSFISPTKDKLETLVAALKHLGNEPGIVFCNFKESINRVSIFLKQHQISHGCFYGGMEQKDRERALIQFRNGTHQIIIATDLAARGLDIPEIKFIIHYHLPTRVQEFTHRNGRTARMHKKGTAYILTWKNEVLPEFIGEVESEDISTAPTLVAPTWRTLFISGGRKDKISKGDIAGVLFKQGNLTKDEVGIIELKQDCAFVAVHKDKTSQVIAALDNTRLKKKKVRVKVI